VGNKNFCAALMLQQVYVLAQVSVGQRMADLQRDQDSAGGHTTSIQELQQ